MSACFPVQYAAPVLAVCGLSGSGKTTLLQPAIPQLLARGLSVAVVKHDAHGFAVDIPGKDSDRLFRAGATVALRGPEEQFQRRGRGAILSLAATLSDLACDHDLVLVEGHKDTPLPKLWLQDADRSEPPASVVGIAAVLDWDSDRLSGFLSYIDSWLPRAWSERTTYGALLVGGQSLRMGSPKQLLQASTKPMGLVVADALRGSRGCRHIVAIGSGVLPREIEELPRLTDALGFFGPVGGALSAHRWSPATCWIMAACDHPTLTAAHVDWLLAQRSAGCWAIVPLQSDRSPCPTLALYEPQALHWLERLALEEPRARFSLSRLLDHPRTRKVTPPAELQGAWQDVDTPEDLRRVKEHVTASSEQEEV